MRRATWILVPWLAAGLACGGGGEAPPAVIDGDAATAAGQDTDAPWPPWTVLERPTRFTPPVRVGISVDEAGDVLEAGALPAAVDAACEAWNATGLVELWVASMVEPAQVTVAWGLAKDGRPSPFGPRPGVAFTRDLDGRIEILLDPERVWIVDGAGAPEGGPGGDPGSGPDLVATLAHELGHVLQLGHTERKDALLSVDPNLRHREPRAPDLAALIALYGPVDTPALPGDLEIFANGTADPVAPPLKALATHANSAFALGDADADGDDELFVWRTDPAGHGSLVVLDFGPGPRVSRTFGPLVGVTLAGAQAGPVRSATDEPLFLVVKPDDGWIAYSLSLLTGYRGFEGETLELADLPGDADGDGKLDLQAPEDRERFARGLQRRVGDLDGDGRLEEVRLARGPRLRPSGSRPTRAVRRRASGPRAARACAVVPTAADPR